MERSSLWPTLSLSKVLPPICRVRGGRKLFDVQYIKIIKVIESAREDMHTELAAWRTKLSLSKLGEEGAVLDLMYSVRADEAEHRDDKTRFYRIKEGQVNPIFDPEAKLDEMLLRYVKDIMTRPTKPASAN